MTIHVLGLRQFAEGSAPYLVVCLTFYVLLGCSISPSHNIRDLKARGGGLAENYHNLTPKMDRAVFRSSK